MAFLSHSQEPIVPDEDEVDFCPACADLKFSNLQSLPGYSLSSGFFAQRLCSMFNPVNDGVNRSFNITTTLEILQVCAHKGCSICSVFVSVLFSYSLQTNAEIIIGVHMNYPIRLNSGGISLELFSTEENPGKSLSSLE
jgi:hypothetical protein